MQRPKITKEFIASTAAAFCAREGWDSDQADDLARVCRSAHMDGYELARRIRAMDAMRSALLVAVTGYGQDSDRTKALAAGFDAHLVKPVDAGKLLQMLASRRRER